jgi:hypothetical protein
MNSLFGSLSPRFCSFAVLASAKRIYDLTPSNDAEKLRKRTRQTILDANTLWIFAPAVFFYNDICALFSRQIIWRGIRYELKSPVQTSIIEENARLGEPETFRAKNQSKNKIGNFTLLIYLNKGNLCRKSFEKKHFYFYLS